MPLSSVMCDDTRNVNRLRNEYVNHSAAQSAFTHLTALKVKLLELLHPFMEYTEEKQKYDDAKLEHKAAHNKILEINEKQAPVTARKK